MPKNIQISSASAKLLSGAFDERRKRFAAEEKEEQKKAEEKAFYKQLEQSRLNQEAQKDTGLFSSVKNTVGDIAGSVGKTLGEGITGGVQTSIEGVKGVKNYLEIAAEQTKQAHGKGDSKRLNELFAEQRRTSKAFDEGAAKSYKMMQYAPGVSMGVEGAGTLAAKAAGKNSDINKRLIKLTQGEDWDKMSDEEKKQALTQRDLGAALSPLDLLGAGKVAGAGIKGTVKGGMKAGAKAASESYGKSVLSKSVGDIAGMGAKEIAKQGAKSTVAGSVVGAGLGVGLNAAMGNGLEGWDEAAKEGAVGGAIGGFLSSPMDVSVGKKGMKDAAIKAEKAAKKADELAKAAEAAKKVEADRARIKQLRKNAEDAYIDSRKTEFYNEMAARDLGMSDGTGNVPQGQKLLPEGTRARTLDEASAELKDIQNATGEYSNATPEVRRQRFHEVRNEIDVANKNAERTDFVIKKDAEVNSGRPVEHAEAELNSLKSGNVPDDMKVEHPMVENPMQIATSKGMPNELRGAAEQIMMNQDFVENQRSGLMTESKFSSEMDALDKSYAESKAKIEQMPPRRQELEFEKLEGDYNAKMDELQQKFDADAATLEDLNVISEHLSLKESQLIADTNAMIMTEPEAFKFIDDAKLKEATATLEKEIRVNEITKSQPDINKPLVGSVEDGIKPSESSNPRVKKAILDSEAIGASSDGLSGGGRNPGLLDNFMGTPRKVMAEWGEAGKKISDALDEAIDSVAIEDHKMAVKVEKWLEEAGGKNGMETIAKALDGDIDSFGKLTRSQQRVFNEVRDMFVEYADRLGIPQEARIKDYLPHMFNDSKLMDIDAAAMQLSAGKNIEGKPLTAAETKKLNKTLRGIDYESLDLVRKNSLYKIENGFLKKRAGANGYSFDLADVILTYTHSAHNTEFLKPTYSMVKELSKELTNGQNEYLAKSIRAIGGRPSDELGEMLNTSLETILRGEHKAYSRASTTARKLIYDATMGFNPGSALRNLQQGVNTYSQIGEKYFMHGFAKAIRSFNRGNGMYGELLEAGVIHNKFSDLLRQGGSNTIRHKFDKSLWGMFTGVEQINRATAYFGAKQRYIDNAIKKAAKEGVTLDVKSLPDDVLKGAMKAGREMSRKTQFEFGALDIPIGQQSTTAKNVLQFQSYNLAQVKFLKNMFVGNADSLFVKNANGKGYHMTKAGTLQVGRLVGANVLFMYTLGQAVGMDKEDLVPYWNEWNRGEVPRSPMVKLLVGQHGKGGLLNIAGAVKDMDADALGYQSGEFAKSAASLLIPGGSQAKKTMEAIDTNIKGFSENTKGKIKFAQDRDDISKLQSAIFGQYTTKAGKRWIDEGFPTLTEKQTSSAYSQGDEEAKIASASYYSAMNELQGKTTTLNKIKEEVGSGNWNKATRILDEYNASIDEAVKKSGISEKYINDDIKNDYSRRFISENSLRKSINNDKKKGM